jgi:hypothetical protein
LQSRSSNLYGLAKPSLPRHAAQSQARPRRRRSRAETRILPRYRPLPSLHGYGACTVNPVNTNSSQSFTRLYVIWLPRQQGDALATVRFDCRLSARAGSSSGAGSSAAPLSGVGSTGYWEVDEPVRQWERAPEETQRGHTVGSIPSWRGEPCTRSRRVLTWRLTLLPFAIVTHRR